MKVTASVPSATLTILNTVPAASAKVLLSGENAIGGPPREVKLNDRTICASVARHNVTCPALSMMSPPT